MHGVHMQAHQASPPGCDYKHESGTLAALPSNIISIPSKLNHFFLPSIVLNTPAHVCCFGSFDNYSSVSAGTASCLCINGLLLRLNRRVRRL